MHKLAASESGKWRRTCRAEEQRATGIRITSVPVVTDSKTKALSSYEGPGTAA